MRFRNIYSLLLLLLLQACALQERVFDPGVAVSREGVPRRGSGSMICRDFTAYIPDSSATGQRILERVLRVNYHFMNARDSSRNYHAEVGTPYVYQLTREINRKLQANVPMSLPAAAGTPVWPVRLSLQIAPMGDSGWDDGVYYHYDDELYAYVHKGRHRNNSDRRVLDRYAIQPDSVINIFILPHHPDSVGSATYPSGGVGIALGMAMKLSGIYERGLPPAEFTGLLAHEIGHILGLSHTWQFNDGCEDTPHHSNCFNIGAPPCDSLLSNNVMDYNTWQQAWTPCQLGRAHRQLSRLDGTARRYLVRDWCRPAPGGDVQVVGEEVWDAEMDLTGNLDILPGGRLVVRCRLSMPEGTRITVHPGAVLILDGAWLHNDCGLAWEGIRIRSKGRHRGKVQVQGDWKIDQYGQQPPH